MPSLMNVPITRLVKNPRLSLTTIGVFLICLAKSSARYSVSSLVFSPLMISSSGILSTGLKKCRPMKSSGRVTFSARPVIGSVEVLEPSSASGARCGSISFEHLRLDRRVLEHGLDHEVGARGVRRVGRWR